MGELLLCNGPIGAMPYYIEGISLNVYTIEELSYYIFNNVYLIDSDFMCEELCTWIDNEVKMRSLAEKLRDIIRSKGKLSAFVSLILTESYYYSEPQINDVVLTLTQLEEKSEFECDKMRADRLMEKEKYLSAVYAYKHLLSTDDAKNAPENVLGNIYHNLGTAYARLFLFEEASNYYQNAYELNQNPESLKELLFCYRCLGDEEQFQNTSLKYMVDDLSMLEIKNELSNLSRNESILLFEQKLSSMSAQVEHGHKTEYNETVSSLLNQWKDEYRRICRV